MESRKHATLLAVVEETLAGREDAARALLARFLGGRDEVTLLDLGIGSGRQVVALVSRLAREGRLPERIRVLAVEPNAASLLAAHRGLWEASAMLGFDLEFRPVNKAVADLDAEDWAFFGSFDAPLVVNAVLATHDVLSADENPTRENLIRCLRALEPVAVVLSASTFEPPMPCAREASQRRAA